MVVRTYKLVPHPEKKTKSMRGNIRDAKRQFTEILETLFPGTCVIGMAVQVTILLDFNMYPVHTLYIQISIIIFPSTNVRWNSMQALLETISIQWYEIIIFCSIFMVLLQRYVMLLVTCGIKCWWESWIVSPISRPPSPKEQHTWDN